MVVCYPFVRVPTAYGDGHGSKEQETRRSPMKRSKRLLILKEHESYESYESYETRRSPTDQREVMTAERKHRRRLLSYGE